jgi:hypothetical protein
VVKALKKLLHNKNQPLQQSLEVVPTFKIAFCFSGQLRTWRKCIHTWQDMFKDLKEKHGVTEIDVFCHIWDHNTLQQSIATKKYGGDAIDNAIDNATVLSNAEISSYLEHLNPIAYKISNTTESKNTTQQLLDQIAKDTCRIYGKCNNEWMSPQFYSIMYSTHLKRMHEIKHNFNYDVCVRMRNDLYLGNSLTDRSIDNMLHPKFNTVYSCHTGVDNSQWFGRRLGDIFWYADSPTFDKMSNFYQWLPTLGAKSFREDDHCGPEHLLYFYAKMFKISIDVIYNDLKIARDDEYVKLKQDYGYGTLGDHEILC